MVWSVSWDQGFVVGGDDDRRLTPNFRLKEFKRPDGTVRVHRELVTAVQMLRDSFARPLALRGTDADGLGATLAAAPVADLLGAADRLKGHHLFEEVTAHDDFVHVRIPDPQRLPEIELEQALESALAVTSGFETSGDRFQQITGNFDGAGLSFGPAQWNFRSRTLVPLFREFERADAPALRECFGAGPDYDEWRRVLDLPVVDQIAWANGISTGRGMQEVIEPWKGYFHAVGRERVFRAVMIEQALHAYGARVLESVRYLRRIAPGVQVDHLRCLCALYDLVVQQGGLEKAREQIERRVQKESPRTQFDLVRIAVEERGRTADSQWQADCVSRRLGILLGVPETVDGHQRANLNFFLLRDVRIRDAQTLIDADLAARVARVADTLSRGDTLLA